MPNARGLGHVNVGWRDVATLGLLVVLALGAAPTPTSALPWSTVSELEDHITQAFPTTGCGDPRPMGLFVISAGSDEYHLLVNADARWAIVGPLDSDGRAVVWYGRFTPEHRIVIERSLVGTRDTNLCPLLVRRSA